MRHTLYYLIYMYIFIFVLKKQLSKYNFITSLGSDLPEKVISAIKSNAIVLVSILSEFICRLVSLSWCMGLYVIWVYMSLGLPFVMYGSLFCLSFYVRWSHIDTRTIQGPMHNGSETKWHRNSDNIETHTERKWDQLIFSHLILQKFTPK
jgi:hypothetical protein